MSKPSWGDAPAWAKYLCQESDGRWVWFEYKPYTPKDCEDWRNRRVGMWDYAKDVVVDWRETLERRP